MIKFFLRMFGYSCCGEWSKWEYITKEYSRSSKPGDGIAFMNGKQIRWTESYQERKCEKCGLIQQQKLEW